MVNSNKILTVSYGTFSCTLEGFEDSFNTMKAIAEYFRDLAAEDRYFGAEPPAPDADMLARIAEKEIARRVEARTEEGGIYLKAAGTPPLAAPEPQPEPAPELAAEPTAKPAPVAPPAVEPAARAPAPAPATEQPASADLPMVSLKDAWDYMDPKAQPPLAHPDPDSVAAKLQRIRAVVSKGTAGAVVAPHIIDFAEDEHADAFLGDVAAEDETPIVPPVAEPVAAPEAEVAEAESSEPEVADEIAEVAEPTEEIVEETAEPFPSMDAPAEADEHTGEAIEDETVEEAAIEETVDIAEPAPETEAEAEAEIEAEAEDVDVEAFGEDADASDDVTPESILNVLAQDDQDAAEAAEEPELDVAEPVAESDGTDEAAAEEQDQPADLGALAAFLAGTAQSDDDDAPVAEHMAEDGEDPEAAAEDTAEETDEPLVLSAQDDDTADNAEEHAPFAAEATDLADEDAADIVAAMPEDEPQDEAALSPEDEADLMSALGDANQDSDEDQQDDVAEVAEEIAEADADHGAAVADEIMLDDETDADAPDQFGDDDDMSRLLAEANSQMEEPEGTRRRSAIAHLRAAVAATKAEHNAGGDLRAETDEDPYREDLARVVRPRRPESTSARTARPDTLRPAPLKLVAEQRVDGGIDLTQTPVRPRRIATDLDAPVLAGPDQEKIAEAGSFSDYAASVGAIKLPELLEAAAAYMAYVEGREQFSRPQLMTRVRQAEKGEFSREDGLRSFGQLLRDGKIEKIRGGRFTVSDTINFKPDQRAAG